MTFFSEIPDIWKYGFIILLVVVCISIFSKWFETKRILSHDWNKKIENLLLESSHWKNQSKQDRNSIYALMNANYAIAYANVCRTLVQSDEELFSSYGINMTSYMKELKEIQQNAIELIGQQCPSIKPDGLSSYAVHTGWMS